MAVLDINKIPKMADVCAISSIYRLYFKPDEVIQNDAFDPENDDFLGDDGDKGLDGSDREMEDVNDANPASDKIDNGAPTTSSAPPQFLPPQQQATLVDVGLDLACEQLLDEICLKVMLESDDGLTRKTYSPRQKKS